MSDIIVLHPVDPILTEADEQCPECHGVWWRAIVKLNKDENPQITGWKTTFFCERCDYSMTHFYDIGE